MSSLSPGIFITFEGGDGSGKTTQIQRLSQTLTERHIPHIRTREPGGTPNAEKLRTLLVQGSPDGWDGVTEAFLMAAARRDHLRQCIWPALESGTWVLCDRFSDSTFAYQGYGHELGEEFVRTLHTLTMGSFQPHLTFIFQLSPDIGVARKQKEQSLENRFEKYPAPFHARVIQGYQTLLAREPERCIAVQADVPPDTITQTLLRVLEQKGFMRAA